MKGNGRETSLPFEVRTIVSHRFHEDCAAVTHNLRQQGDSFTQTGDNSHEILEIFS